MKLASNGGRVFGSRDIARRLSDDIGVSITGADKHVKHVLEKLGDILSEMTDADQFRHEGLGYFAVKRYRYRKKTPRYRLDGKKSDLRVVHPEDDTGPPGVKFVCSRLLRDRLKRNHK